MVLPGERRVADAGGCGDRGELDDLLRAAGGEIEWAPPPGEIS